ncbi:hypothetical protein [Methylobacterium sp. Leaf399]|uniref:hypothetical protein n=1 Tax=Methylobacterium sp. Leaf399 TaxID=1736364 RepID=UPI0009EAF556|nr:hypothetical protein [Methylobacterium sp. Leaf399]
MPRRAALVTQADIARAIRAAQAAGLSVHRVVVRADGVAVETNETLLDRSGRDPQEGIAREGRVVVL